MTATIPAAARAARVPGGEPPALRILYFADTRFPLERANGIQTFETTHALATRGHLVRLVVRADTHRPPRDPFAFYGAPPVPLLEISALALRGPAAVRRAAYLAVALELASRREADVLFTRDLGVAALLLRLPPRLRPPVIYESHGNAAVVSGEVGTLLSTGRSASVRKQRRLARRERLVWTRADGYVTLTRALATELRDAFGTRPHTAIVADGTRTPAEWSAPPAGPFRVAYAGHLYPWKGVDTLVRALALTSGVAATIVGGHPAEPDLGRVRALVESLSLRDRVTFTGLVAPAEVAAHLRSAHALALPNSATTISSRYTSPLKLFEYLAAGRPLVASDLQAFREVLTEEEAVLVPPDDPRALAASLARLRDDGEARARMGAAAFARAAGYTWAARAARLEALCLEVVARRA